VDATVLHHFPTFKAEVVRAARDAIGRMLERPVMKGNPDEKYRNLLQEKCEEIVKEFEGEGN